MRRDGDVKRQFIPRGDQAKQIDVPFDQSGLGHDAQTQPALFGDDLQDAARNQGAFLDGLVGVSGRSQRDLFAALQRSKFLPQ